MKLEEKIHVLRFMSGILNSIFLILGLSIFGCAAWILFDDSGFLSFLTTGSLGNTSVELKTVAGALFVIGLVVVAVFAVGCAGAQTESRVLMITYMSFLVMLVLGQAFVGLVLYLNKDKIGASLYATINGVIVNYGHTSDREPQDIVLDNVQHYGRCCGRMGPADWLENSFIKNQSASREELLLPCSCFNSTRCPLIPGSHTLLFGLGNDSYVEGCEAQINDWLEENALTVIGMDASLFVIQVLQFILFVYLYQTVGEKTRLKRAKAVVHPPPEPEPQHDPYYEQYDPEHQHDPHYEQFNPEHQHDPHYEQFNPEHQPFHPEYEQHDPRQYYMEQNGAENRGYMYGDNGYIEPPPQ